MPKRSAVGGMGLGPTLIILFLLIASLWAVYLGQGLAQLAARIAIVAVIVGIIYFVWLELAKRNPAFRMGAAGETTIILAVVAVALIFVSNPIASAAGLAVVPNYSLFQVTGGIQLESANSQIATLFLIAGLVLLVLLLIVHARSK